MSDDKKKLLQQKHEQMVALQQEMEQIAGELQSETTAKPLAMCQFVLFNNGSVDIKVDWEKEGVRNQEALGVCLGSLLHTLTSGKLNTNVYQAMLSGANNNLEYQPVIDAAINEWNDLLKDSEMKFVVHPSAVFGVTRAQGGEFNDELISDDIEDGSGEGSPQE